MKKKKHAHILRCVIKAMMYEPKLLEGQCGAYCIFTAEANT